MDKRKTIKINTQARAVLYNIKKKTGKTYSEIILEASEYLNTKHLFKPPQYETKGRPKNNH